MNKDAVAEMSQPYQVEAAKKIVPEGYKQTEVGVVPESWAIAKLGERSSFIGSGKTNTKQSGNYPLYGSTGLIGSCPNPEYDGEAILVARVGANAGKLNFVNGKYGVSDNTIITRLKSDSNIHYFKYWLVRKNLNTLVFGSGQPLITGTQLKELLLPVPAMSEQVAIANVLSDTDALLSELEKLIAKKQAIKTATMQQLLTGRTRLPQFAHHPDGSKKGYKQSELGEIPEDWEVISFDEVAQRINTKKNQISASDYQSYGSYPVVDQGKKKIVGYSDLECKVFTVSDAGVIVFGDHTCIVKYVDFSFLVGADGVQVILGREGFNTRFLFYVMSFFPVEPTGYNRHYGALREFVYSFPKQEEQITIATILADMDEEIQALEHRLNKTRQIKQGMMQELLTGKTRLIKGGKNV